MKISSIMESKIHTIDSSLSVKDAAETMKNLKIGAVVITNGTKMEGILSERDIMNKIVSNNLIASECKVTDFMTSNLITIEDSENLESALKLMEEKKIRHLPVINSKNEYVGILGIRDIMRAVLKKMEDENETLSQYIMADGPGG